MQTKTLLADIKAAPNGSDLGQFTGYASVFNNVDSYGDKVIPGAFSKSLESYGDGGANIPCYWSHDMSDPMKCIGWTTAAVEDEHGLKVDVQLDLENPNGAQAYKLIKNGVVNQMSFAYEVEDAVSAKSDGEGTFTELRQLKIFEVSLVQVGANQSTELLDVKHRLLDGVKAGGEFTADDKSKLSKAVELITEVLETVDDSPSDDSSEESPTGNAEEQETAKAEDQQEVKARKLSPVDIAEIELKILGGI